MALVLGPRTWLPIAAMTSVAGCADAPDEPPGCVARTSSAIYSGFAASGDAAPSGALGEQARAIAGIEDSYGNTYCTGVVVHPRWVLTAAHCADPEAILRVVGRAGAGVAVPVKEALTHPAVDLALLEVLAPQVLVREEIPTAALRATPVTADVTVGTLVLLAGVGLTEDGGTGQLRFAEEPVTEIGEATIRVDGNGKSGACEGDSGGPLLARTEEGLQVVGILRAGSANCRGLDEYIRVDAHHGWITEHLLPLGSPSYCAE